MKILLTILTAGVFLISSAQDMEQFISYEVPIHVKAVANYKGEIIDLKTELSTSELSSLSITRLEVTTRLKLINTIISKIKSGEIVAYYPDMYAYSGDISAELPEKYFQNAIPIEEISSVFSTSTPEASIDYETGLQIYDEFGNPEYIDINTECTTEDFISLTFYENWTIDKKTNVLSKEVKGYTINIANTINYEILGSLPICYIPCVQFRTKKKTLVENFETNTMIKHETEGYNNERIDNLWWKNCLLPATRNRFLGKNEHAPFASSNKPKELYHPMNGINILNDFPYTQLISHEEAVISTTETELMAALDMNTGIPMYDEYGNPMYEEVSWKYEESDIQHLSFIETWYFDEESLSIQKKIKGIAPTTSYRDQNGDIIGLKSFFWIKY